ncbi:MAG TPA: hypothetical protein VGB77_00075 [Abditibacteriaceae bacterium]
MSRAFKHIRNKDYSQWSTERLQEQILYYERMEMTVKDAKSRRTWQHTKQQMEVALAKRLEQSNNE